MKTIRTFEILFSGLGLSILAGGAFWIFNQIQFLNSAAVVEGTVIDLIRGEVYNPVYSYEYPPGKEHVVRSSAGSNPPAYEIGEKVKVYVDPATPSKGEISGFTNLWMGPVFLSGFGAIFASIGLGMIFWRRRKQQLRDYLLRNGETVKAEITEVSLNPSLEVNGRNPYRVHAQYRKGADVFLFESENLWFDPKPYMDRNTVDVYWNPLRPKEYWVDLRFLPEPANA